MIAGKVSSMKHVTFLVSKFFVWNSYMAVISKSKNEKHFIVRAFTFYWKIKIIVE